MATLLARVHQLKPGDAVSGLGEVVEVACSGRRRTIIHGFGLEFEKEILYYKVITLHDEGNLVTTEHPTDVLFDVTRP